MAASKVGKRASYGSWTYCAAGSTAGILVAIVLVLRYSGFQNEYGIQPLMSLPLDVRLNVAQFMLPDAYDILPEQFDPTYRNPCWRDDPKSALQCLPYFYILGMWQSGVRDMSTRLKVHGDIKEISTLNYWFEDHKLEGFPAAFESVTNEIEEDPKRAIVGDAAGGTFSFLWAHSVHKFHPKYMKTMADCWPKCDAENPGDTPATDACHEQCFVTARAADHALVANLGGEMELPWHMEAVHGQNVRLVVLLRDPVLRLHSAFWYYIQFPDRYGASEEGFLKYVEEQTGLFEECEDEFGARACALRFETHGLKYERLFFHADQVIKGIYSVFLEEWLAAFPNGQVLVIKAEDYFKRPGRELKKVFKHLGLRKPSHEEMNKIFSIPIQGPNRADHKQMLPRAKKLLEEFYAPFNERLAELLKDKRFLWKH